MTRWMRRLWPALLVLNVTLGAGLAYARHLLYEPGPLPEARDVAVPRGGARQIADALAQAGVIAHPLAFRLAAYATRNDGALHAAEFSFPAHAMLADVLAVLRTAHPVQHRLTIPEGLTARQIAAAVDAQDAMTGTAEIGAEGSLLPQTYAFERGATRASVLDRARAAMSAAVEREWAARDPSTPLATPVEAVTLASIVERETGRPDERPHVAAVFLNRLRLGMQSHPTAAYAASGGGTLDHRLTRAELDRDDPYNTYRAAGLPPGPIFAPGIASLHAALHPDASDDLFFVADGAGGHAFARTLAEHQRNVDRWRAGRG